MTDETEDKRKSERRDTDRRGPPDPDFKGTDRRTDERRKHERRQV